MMRFFQVFILACRTSFCPYGNNLHNNKYLQPNLTQSLQTDLALFILLLYNSVLLSASSAKKPLPKNSSA